MSVHKAYIVFLCIFTALYTTAQESETTVIPIIQTNSTTQPSDTVKNIRINEEDLSNINNLRSQFEKQNSTYSVPKRKPKSLLRFINRDKLEMSEEAKRLANYVADASALFDMNMTFKDTVIVNPLFMPLLFTGSTLPLDKKFYDPEKYCPEDPFDDLKPTIEVFPEYKLKKEIYNKAYNHLTYHHLDYFKYSENDLPGEIIIPTPIIKDITDIYNTAPIPVKKEVDITDVDAPVRFIPDRLYWRSAFESVFQFSQNYISKNWDKGGISTLNLFTKNHVRYDYNRDKVQFTNEMELKVSVYTAPKDTERSYKIGDDLLRFHSNFGYQAYNKWYYTLDAEFKTSIFKNYKENSQMLQSAFLSPFSVTLGLGMKYNLDKAFESDKHKKLKLALNMAPATYTYLYSVRDDETKIDLGRHGFQKDPETGKFDNHLSQLGSSLRADFSMSFNRNVSFQSRLYYFTNYERVLAESENTLTMAISRFFSTRIYLYLRYDDGVEPIKKDRDLGYFQLNELLSFGFNYKW